jgi:small subunit ribosomal protein S20
MANLRSSKKDIRRSARHSARNRSVRMALRTLAKKVANLRAGEDSTATRSAAIAYVSALDRAAKKGIIHRNRASRGKSACSPIIFS